jgi:hypothetical protein
MERSAKRIVIPRPSEYRRWRFEYWHARTHAYGRREALEKASRVLARQRTFAAGAGTRVTG